MINNINLCQNIQIPQNLAFKSKQEGSYVSSPIENSNLNGAEALASYNSAFINNRNPFNIPLLEPIDMPGDINAIEGERIYNSKGVLKCVVKDTKDKKYVYSYDSNDSPIINNIEIYDKKTGNKIFDQYEYVYDKDGKEHRYMNIAEYDSVTGLETASSLYIDMMPSKKQITKYGANGCEYISYYYDNAECAVYKHSGNSSFEKTYDINGKLKNEFYDECNDDGTYRQTTFYKNGKEVSKETTKKQAIMRPEYQKYINNTELTPVECPEFLTSIENIEGEKTYYSNGQLESVRTNDGKYYEISLNGNYITLQDGNKTIGYSVEKGTDKKFCTITEDLGNATKRTMYSGKNGDELWSVEYTKGNIKKCLNYANGKPDTYSEDDISNNDWREILYVAYAPNGGVLEVRTEDDRKRL